jgi:hypothetical protein
MLPSPIAIEISEYRNSIGSAHLCNLTIQNHSLLRAAVVSPLQYDFFIAAAAAVRRISVGFRASIRTRGCLTATGALTAELRIGALGVRSAYRWRNTVKNAVELLGAFRPDVEKIQYH